MSCTTSPVLSLHALRRLLTFWAVTLLWLASVELAQAARVPDFDRPIVLAAREQPVGQFISELFGQIGVPVRVDDSVRGTVNGDFNASASGIFDDIARSFQLSYYFDGALVWVYPANAITRDFMPVSAGVGQRVMNTAASLDMLDARNRLEMSDAGLVITGTTRFVEQVQELAGSVQPRVADAITAPSPPDVSPQAVMRVFKLRYAWAGDVELVVGGDQVRVPGVATLLRQLVEPGAVRGVTGPERINGGNTLEGLRGQGLISTRAGDDPSVAGEPLSLAVTQLDDGNTSSTRIVADTLSNSVVVRDRADRMESYADLIAALDVEQEMIEIEATIIDLNTSRLRDLGINWRLQGTDAQASFGDQQLVPGGDIAGIGEGGILSLVLGDSTRFLARIRALEQQGAARVVSKPHVMTLSNVEALLDTTSTFFVRVAGEEEVDLFDVSVGTTLRVTPHVFETQSGSRIKLRVNIEDGSTTAATVDSIPVIERSTITTQALVNENESLLIGGLVRELSGNTITKVPVLGSIPVVGALFRSNEQNTTRVERMFLISPRINLRAPQGLRYDAPVSSGTESDIIQSAGSRLEPAVAALASREDRESLELPLARNGRNVQLAPASQTRAEALPPPPAPQREPGLRERMMHTVPGSVTMPVNRAAPGQPHAPATPTAPVPEAPVPAAVDDGWQEVNAASPESPMGQSEAFLPTSMPDGGFIAPDVIVPAVSTGNLDEWQEIVE